MNCLCHGTESFYGIFLRFMQCENNYYTISNDAHTPTNRYAVYTTITINTYSLYMK